jgi:hypothetical protein
MKREIDREKGFTRLDALVAAVVIAMIVTTSLAALVPAMNKAREAAMRAQCAAQLKEIGAAISIYADAYDGFLPWYGGRDPNFPPPFNSGPIDSEKHSYLAYRCSHSDSGDQKCQDLSKTCVCGAIGKPVPMRLACLYAGGYINDASKFYCPANLNPAYEYNSYTNSQWGSEWGTPHQLYSLNSGGNDWIRTGYSYYPIDGFFDGLTYPVQVLYAPYINTSQGISKPKYTARKYANLSGQCPYLADLILQRTLLSHKAGIEMPAKMPIGAGINALFKDGHVIYVKDQPVKFKRETQTFFNNYFWAIWDPPPPPREVQISDNGYILFNLFKLIQIQP